jgi:hypothetical protein
VSAAGNSAGTPHGFQEFLLIRARVFARKFNFDIDSSSIRNTVAPYIGFAVFADVDHATVLRVELPYRVVYGVAAVLTEGYDDLVL